MSDPKNKYDTILRFECGAVMFSVGSYQHAPDAERHQIRKKDGRRRIGVFMTGGDFAYPTLLDGSRAPCLFDCPAKRASGRRVERCWTPAQEGKNESPGGIMVGCYPAEEPLTGCPACAKNGTPCGSHCGHDIYDGLCQDPECDPSEDIAIRQSGGEGR